jgi:hypothetical protein
MSSNINKTGPAYVVYNDDGSVAGLYDPKRDTTVPVSNTSTEGKGYSQRAKNSVAGSKMRSNDMVTTGASGISTLHGKWGAEAPFSAVRMFIGEKNVAGGGVPGNWTALLGVTDTAAIDTVNNAYLPVSLGVLNNAILAIPQRAGWVNVTWDDGQTSKNHHFAEVASNSMHVIASDIIPIKSIPRTDVVGGRPMLLYRACQTLASGIYTQGSANLSALYANSAGASFRERFTTKTANNAVSTLGNNPASVSATGGFEQYVWFEFYYDVPVRNVWFTGDSRKSSAFNEYNMSFIEQALNELSTPAAPINAVNMAGSGHSQAQFSALLDAGLAAGMTPPTDLFYPAFSQNGFVDARTYLARAEEYIQKFRELGTRIWMDTDYAVSAYSANQEAERVRCINQAKAWAAQGLVTLLDFDAAVTDYSGAVGAIPAAAQVGGDSLHVGPATQVTLKNIVKANWS